MLISSSLQVFRWQFQSGSSSRYRVVGLILAEVDNSINNSWYTISSALYAPMYLSPTLGTKSVTLWWCYTTALGTLGVTRHLLGLVSLGTKIQGFKQNREELNVYHLLSYHLLNQMSGTRHQHHKVTQTRFTIYTNRSSCTPCSPTSVQAKQYPINAFYKYYRYSIYQLKYN